MAYGKLALLALAVSSCLHLVSAFQPLPRPDHLAQTAATAESSTQGGGGSGRTCSYTVRIKTSCSSPPRTSDAISLAFGDAYRNEVYAAGLAGSSSSRAFERCSTDTFRIGGPCGYGVCYLYLRRAGRVGWTPEWVRVYEPTSDTPSTFYYGDPLPDSVWYGFNRCPNRAAASYPSSAAAAARAL